MAGKLAAPPLLICGLLALAIVPAIVVEAPPLEAAFSVPLTVPSGVPVSLIDESSSGATITNWEWDFDSDGTVDSTVQHPMHAFAIGLHVVTLTVTDDNEETASAAHPVQAVGADFADWQIGEPTAGQDFSGFGEAIAMDGDVAVIGAPQYTVSDQDLVMETGAAYVYRLSGNTWTPEATLIPSPDFEATGSDFGAAISIQGDTLWIGAPNWGQSEGAAYGFQFVDDAWTQTSIITGAPGELLGTSLDLHGSILAIGRPGISEATGSVALHDVRGSPPPLLTALVAPESAPGTLFGESLALTGQHLLVGAPADNAEAGAAYLYEAPSWTYLRSFDGPSADGWFGFRVALDGPHMAIANWPLESAGQVFTSHLTTSWAALAPLGATIDDWSPPALALQGGDLMVRVVSEGQASLAPYQWQGAWTPSAIIEGPPGNPDECTECPPIAAAFGQAMAIHQGAAWVGNPDTDSATPLEHPVTIPRASFEAPQSVLRGDSFRLRDTSTDDGTIVSWDWDLDGDGAPDATGRSPTHAFATSGQAVVQLTVTDDEGNTDQSSQTINVRKSPPPRAAFSPTTGFAGEPIQFVDQSTDDGEVVFWRWTFGTGQFSSESNPIHTFPEPGTYTVWLVVHDEHAQPAIVSQEVIVTERPAAEPEPEAEPETTSVEEPEQDPPEQASIVVRTSGGGKWATMWGDGHPDIEMLSIRGPVDGEALGVVEGAYVGDLDPADIRIVLVAPDGTITVLAEGVAEFMWDTTNHDNGLYSVRVELRVGGTTLSQAGWQYALEEDVFVRNPPVDAGIASGAVVAGTGVAVAGAAMASRAAALIELATESAIAGGEEHGTHVRVQNKHRWEAFKARHPHWARFFWPFVMTWFLFVRACATIAHLLGPRLQAIRSTPAFLLGLFFVTLFFTMEGMGSMAGSEFLQSLPIIGLAALIFALLATLAEIALAHASGSKSAIKLYGPGILAMAASASIFRVAVGYPSYVNESGKEPRPFIGAARSLALLCGILSIIALFVLASLIHFPLMEEGIAIALAGMIAVSLPIAPLPGYNIWQWSKIAAGATYVLTAVFFVATLTAVISMQALFIIGVSGLIVFSGLAIWIRVERPLHF